MNNGRRVRSLGRGALSSVGGYSIVRHLSNVLFVSVLLAAVLFRLSMTSPQVSWLRDFRVDDRLYLDQAVALSQGHWLGDYDHSRLSKAPGYAIFLASASKFGVPRLLAEGLASSLAAILLAVAARRLGWAWPIAALVAVIWMLSPSNFTSQSERVTRDYFFASISGIALGLAGLALTAKSTTERWWTTVLLGLTLGYGTIVREDGLHWAIPFALVFLGMIVAAVRNKDGSMAQTTAAVAVAIFLVGGCFYAACAANEKKFGVFCLSEQQEKSFEDAVGAIRTVAAEDEKWRRYEPITHAAIKACAEASPTFKEIADYMHGPSFRDPGNVDESGERLGVFSMWAFREAATAYGKTETAPLARDFYRKIADELNAALSDGRIRRPRRLYGVTPAVHKDGLPTAFRTTKDILDDVGHFRGEYIEARTIGDLARGMDEPTAAAYRRFLREPSTVDVRPLANVAKRRESLVTIATRMNWVVFAFAALLLLPWMRSMRLAQGGRASLWLAVAAIVFLHRLAICTYIETYWFGSSRQYLLGFYALLPIVLILFSAGRAEEIVRRWRMKRSPKADPAVENFADAPTMVAQKDEIPARGP